MLKNMAKLFVIFSLIVLVTGCSSTRTIVKKEPGATTTTVKKFQARFYSENRDRVDQTMKGNFGYVDGTPIPVDRSKLEKTRKMYVFEITKNVAEAAKVDNLKVEPYKMQPSEPLPPVEKLSEPAWAKPVVIPAIGKGEPKGKPSMKEYVVQQGDTLQKISKKFYGSYRKWLKIYKANTDVLKDPNHIKSGVKIQIPMD